MQDLPTVIASAISAIAAAVVAWVAVKAFYRFKSQKWWERQCDSYLKVLDALADADAYYDRELRATARQSDAPDEQIADLLEKARNADREIQKAIDLAELFISKEAHQRLVQYRMDINAAGRTTDEDGTQRNWTSHLIDTSEAIATCRADMIKIAKRDLGLPEESP
ncbi:MAG: hypothetical protein F4Y02_05480 [Chloroflexi bacterium]|nr:hypothetical protein [Chloroflexota bacterium]